MHIRQIILIIPLNTSKWISNTYILGILDKQKYFFYKTFCCVVALRLDTCSEDV